MLIDIVENGIRMVVAQSEATGTLLLLHLSPEVFDAAAPKTNPKHYPMVEVQRSGEDRDDHCGAQHTASNPGGSAGLPTYVSHRDIKGPYGRRLEFLQSAGDLHITSIFEFFDGIPVIRASTIVENAGDAPIPIEYVSSFALTGLGKSAGGKWSEHNRIHLPFNSWTAELQWRSFSLTDLGLSRMGTQGYTMQRITSANTGTFGAKEMLPMGCLENISTGSVTAWQIETHSSWQWEISEIASQLCLRLSGPTEQENHWYKVLRPGERFASVPATVAMAGSFESAFQALNTYRRRIRRPNADNHNLPVIFNDYMNCLSGDPTAEKLMPLIDRASSLGADYFVIDAGWYADGPWWDSVGEWKESAKRFPDGLQQVIGHIRNKGMKPGLWLEIERMGKNCSLAQQWPDECFFCRHQRRVVQHQSLQLDFRHPIVRNHADSVIERLVGDMGIRFIKMDYNVEAGPGTEIAADSAGDGLLLHQRAYLNWLDDVLARYPDLVIENCASGGLRNTYSLLSRLSICSTTDNVNYLANAKISINSATAYCMEQAGVWSYPLAEASDEEVIMNMVSCLSWRPYLSGQISALNEPKLELIREGIRLYKTYLCRLIPRAQPIWPLGLAKQGDAWSAFGLRLENKLIVSVWRFDEGPDEITIPLPARTRRVSCIYPSRASTTAELSHDQSAFKVRLDQRTARIFEITC